MIIYGRLRIWRTFMLWILLRRKRGAYLRVKHGERDLAQRDLDEQLAAQVELPYP